MTELEIVEMKKELDKLIDAREAFLAYIDANVPKEENGLVLDFSQHPTLDAQSVYEHFFKLDYQARKIRGLVIQKCGIKV